MVSCTQCGTPVTTKFCQSCGAKVAAPAATTIAAPAANRSPSPSPRLNASAGSNNSGGGGRGGGGGGASKPSGNGVCGHCNQDVGKEYMSANGKVWHYGHFTCANCTVEFGNDKAPFYPHTDGKAYCETHYRMIINGACNGCGKLIEEKTIACVLDLRYHWKCYMCATGPHEFKDGDKAHEYDGAVYCFPHLKELMKVTCSACSKPITGDYIAAGSEKFHNQCWKCRCGAKLKDGEKPTLHNGVWLCPACLKTELAKAAAAADRAQFKVGDRVHVKQSNGELWPGTITAVNGDGTYTVAYDNGDTGNSVKRPQLLKIEKNDPDFDKGNGRWGKNGNPEFDGYVTEWDEFMHYIALPFYPYEKLVPSVACPPHINGGPIKAKFRVFHLDDEVFLKMFKMNKMQFMKLQQWRQDALKKNMKLF